MQGIAVDSDLFFTDVLRECAPSPGARVSLAHPFLCGTVDSPEIARELLEQASQALSSPPSTTASFAGPDASARCWRAEIDGRSLEGVTAAVRTPRGIEVRVLLRSFPVVSLWRRAVRERSAGLVDDNRWELPRDTDRSITKPAADEAVDAHLPFGLTDDAVFHSPVLVRPVRGAALIAQVIGNASAVYGERTSGPTLAHGADALSLWTGGVSGIPIHAATVIRFAGPKQVSSIRVLMQPWPAVELFRDRVRARAEGLIGPEYFGD